MSHIATAVFHRQDQSVEELLAPYDEGMKVAPYIVFTREEAIDYAREHYDMEERTDEECWQMMAEDALADEDGNIYSAYNPQSQWDWWVIGGRFSGMLLKDGEQADSGRVGDLEFPFDEEAYEKALRFWDVAVDHKPAREGERSHTIYKEQYYRDFYGDRETYARFQTQFSTFAVITPDGAWHSRGKMGWWGCSSETPEEAREWEDSYQRRFLDSADPEWYVTIVDCHI